MGRGSPLAMEFMGRTDDLDTRTTTGGGLGSGAFADELRRDRCRRVANCVEVVTAFKNRDDSAWRDGGGERADQVGHVGRRIAEFGDRVGPVAIKTGGDQ